jgi:hypothetical protein
MGPSADTALKAREDSQRLNARKSAALWGKAIAKRNLEILDEKPDWPWASQL